MSRAQSRVDANQSPIVEALRKAGCSVDITSDIGNGFPDIVAGRAFRNYLLEIKDENGVLTPDQVVWHNSWRGQVATVRTIEAAFAVVGLGKSKR